jgi:metal-dependent amidase/aminoacylase/carboxypeptidase family protein
VATAEAFKADVKVIFRNLLNGLVNDEPTATACAAVGREFLGSENVFCNDPPSLGGEDFADYTAQVPGCMMTLGTAFPDKKVTPVHTATFDLNEAGLLFGPRLLVRCLFDWGKKKAAAS